tara:strand:- start:3561 stop:4277 length:717 start_codon:yes stop_codon:yes gene_type:complete
MNLRVLRSSLDSLSITKIKKYMALKYVNILINLDKIKIIYNLYKYNIILIFINLWENNKNIGRQNMLLQYSNTHSLNLNLKYRGHPQGATCGTLSRPYIKNNYAGIVWPISYLINPLLSINKNYNIKLIVDMKYKQDITMNFIIFINIFKKKKIFFNKDGININDLKYLLIENIKIIYMKNNILYETLIFINNNNKKNYIKTKIIKEIHYDILQSPNATNDIQPENQEFKIFMNNILF